MAQPTAPKRFSPWLRFLTWFAFCILCLATFLVATRWLLMNHGHQETLRITGSQKKRPTVPRQQQPRPSTDGQEASQGLPLSAVPNFGRVLTGSKDEWKAFEKRLADIEAFLKTGMNGNNPTIVDGVLSFRAMLRNMGGEVSESMTEAEAAKEFLRRTDQFSDLLAQWREAVAAGPMAREQDYNSNPNMWRFNMLQGRLSDLVQMNAMARLHAGDSDAAWTDWQVLKSSNDRLGEIFPEGSGRDCSMNHQMFKLAGAGIQMGAWSDSQMAEMSAIAAKENFIASAQSEIERRKKGYAEYYGNFRKHEAEFRNDFLKTPNQFNQLVNQVKMQLITDQQIKDNQALSIYRLDQQLSRFDPVTGYYMQPTEAEKEAAAETRSKPGGFGSYYFMIADLNGGVHDYTAIDVIRQQAQYDQLRFSTALETYHRKTGSYPEHLEDVSGQFPGGAPQDIATGQPYFYQREADGGYKLWSTGFDGKSDGGGLKNDVTLKQRARKN